MVPLAGLEPATHPHLGCTFSRYKRESLPLSYRGIGLELEVVEHIYMKVICLTCAIEFDKMPNQIKKSPNHFCSQSCAAKKNNRHFPKRTVGGKCLHCFRAIRACNKYCSKDCMLKLTNVQYNTTIGEYRKQHGKRNFHVNLRGQSRRVYISSGLPLECFYCGYKKHVNICHKRDIADFHEDTLIKEINSIENLVALCPTHHWEFDNDCLD